MDLNQQMEKAVDRLMKTRGVQHAILSVESRDGSFQWSGARGTAGPDGSDITVRSRFWIASITKMFIAATVLKIFESGRIRLDEPVRKYLPPGLMTGVHMVDGTDAGRDITVQQLLRHTSGIPDYLEIRDRDGKTLIDRVTDNPEMTWEIRDILDIVRTADRPLFAPGQTAGRRERARYSDTNYQILTEMIRYLMEADVDLVMKELLWDPLGLEMTSLPGGKTVADAEEPAAVWLGRNPFIISEPAMRSFGDLFSTTADLIRFFRALSGGQVFRQDETLRLMMENWNTLDFSLSPLAPGWPIQYGMGTMRFQMPRLLSPLKPRPELVGHTGAVGSWLFYCPQLDMITAGTVGQSTAAGVPFSVLPALFSGLLSEGAI